MVIEFGADTVEIEETQFGVLCVGFYAEENYLMFQQSHEMEDAIYYIERDDQSYSCYGGVEKINLSQNKIEVNLTENGKEKLECNGLQICFETDDEKYQLLSTKLRGIFGKILTVN